MPDPSPSAKLQELRDSLKSNKESSVNLIKEITVLESRVAELSRITGEIEQKVVAYGKARSDLEKQRNEFDDFAKAKQKMLEDSLPDAKGIADMKTHGEEAVQRVETSLKQFSEKVDQAQAELKGLEKTLETKKSDYASMSDFGGGLSKNLKDLQDLKKLADQENDHNNFARMYFYVLEMGARLAEVKVPIASEYRKALEDAAISLTNATEDVRKKKDELDSAIAGMKKKQGEYDDAKAKRRESTVAVISEGMGDGPA